MKRVSEIAKYALVLFTLSLTYVSCFAQSFRKVPEGALINLKPTNKYGAKKLMIQIVSKDIIHVQVTANDSIYHSRDLMLVNQPVPSTPWNLTYNKKFITIHTRDLIVKVNRSNGHISFRNNKGNIILQEAAGKSKSFKSFLLDGKLYYHIHQIFNSPTDEAFYGLGEHQSGLLNLKRHDLVLAQHNTEAAVPYLLSSRHYGILWDNYSITRFGDDSPYQEISSLKLFGRDGRPGGLTAVYRSKKDTSKIFHTRIEKSIDYQYLSKLNNLPVGFEGNQMANSQVIWQGYMASGYSGLHHINFTSAGYAKLWINGKLLVDRWRQAWNPVTSKVEINLVKGKKYPVKIEWIPDGGQSFIALKWRKPNSQLDKHELSLYSQTANEINYFFVYGKSMDDLVHGYRKLTGKAPIMPKWAMGFWQSREHYASQKQILSVVKKFRDQKIPLDNIVQDWFYWKKDQWGSQRFDSQRYPNPQKMIEELHDKYHTHYMISVWPKFYTNTKEFNYFWNKGWLYKKNVENKQKDWVGYVSTFYDAFNPHARKAFWNLVNNRLFHLGVDAWWLDASEPDIYSNTTIKMRKELMNPTYLGPSSEYFNAYPLVNAEAFYNGQRRTKPNQRVFILTRSAYAGLQRYSAAVWSGDTGTTWKDMKRQIAAGLNFSMSGIPFWTMDIGGFASEQRYIHPDQKNLKEWRELMTRWYQFGAFCPIFRAHGQYPDREVYNIAEKGSPTYNSIVYYDKMRYRLMPYIYSLDAMTYFDDYTPMRALIMDFPEDRSVYSINDEFMFGPDLLINPVSRYKERTRKVYLPKNQGWYNMYTGEYYRGGQTITANAPYSRIPVFVKAGSIIPFGPELQYAEQKPANPITLFVYEGNNAHFTLYEDEGNNYDYQEGKYSEISLSYDTQSGLLTIDNRKGSYPGMPEERTFRIIRVSINSPRSLDLNEKPDEIIQYNGQKKVIKIK